mmetsp:Transcript_84338/g.132869  ORF Transcript_84338/g.132869 Transcript_84338/m.132869 type:complete len:112 (+) Transcript_84338:34-369(+)
MSQSFRISGSAMDYDANHLRLRDPSHSGRRLSLSPHIIGEQPLVESEADFKGAIVHAIIMLLPPLKSHLLSSNVIDDVLDRHLKLFAPLLQLLVSSCRLRCILSKNARIHW